MASTIQDKAAIEYVSKFYIALGEGEQVVRAHEIGRNAIQWANLQGHEVPVLFERPQARPRVLRRSQPSSDREINSEAARRIPWITKARNPFFTGRSSLLAEIHQRLNDAPSTTPRSLALVGLGGIGKTQVAVEYCHRYREEYPAGILWLDADSLAALESALGNLVDDLELVDRSVGPRRLRLAVLDWLQGHEGWLVVFDNVGDPAVLRPSWPTVGGGLHGFSSWETG